MENSSTGATVPIKSLSRPRPRRRRQQQQRQRPPPLAPQQQQQQAQAHNAATAQVPRGKTPPLPQPSPQLKVTVRNIGHHANKMNSIPLVIDMIRLLIEKANDKLMTMSTMATANNSNSNNNNNNPTKLVLSESEIRRLLAVDEAVTKAKQEFAASKTKTTAKTDEESTAVNEEAAAAAAAAATTTTSETTTNETIPTTPAVMVVPDDDDYEEDIPIDPKHVTVRVLSVIPPRKTRRRGEKPGVAYLILQSSSALPTPNTTTITTIDSSSDTDAGTNYHLPQQQVAKRRAQLQRVLDVLQQIALMDQTITKANELVGYTIEESVNQKGWKEYTATTTKDKLDGTIFETPDYLNFLEEQTKVQQERMARPKPAPGGSNGGGAIGVGEDGKPVAALVKHLLAKKEAQKKLKTTNKKPATKEVTAKNKVEEAVGVTGAKKKRPRKRKPPNKGSAPKPADG